MPFAASMTLRLISCVVAALLLDGGGDGAGDLGHLGDGRRDLVDRADGIAGRGLHARNLRGDVAGRLGRLRGQRLDLLGDDREALAGLAGARRLDGGVEREQVGLAGDRVDEVDDVADAIGGYRESPSR